LIILTAAAVRFDLRRDKIPNRLILYGMITGIFFRLAGDIFLKNLWDIPVIILEFLSLFVCLWPLYRMSALGAGDCKLLLMTGIFLPVKPVFFIFITSLFIAAAAGVLKMLFYRGLKKKKGMMRIHFSVSVFTAVCLYAGRVWMAAAK